VMTLFRPALERHRLGWTGLSARMAKAEAHRRNGEGPSSWLAANLSSAEVLPSPNAKAVRWCCMTPLSQQSDGVLAAGALVHLVAELQALRGEMGRAAPNASDMAQHLCELLGDQGAHHCGTATVPFDGRNLDPEATSRNGRDEDPRSSTSPRTLADFASVGRGHTKPGGSRQWEER
jgi:hypothetical protein